MAKAREQLKDSGKDVRQDVVAFGVVLARYRREKDLTQERLSWNSGVDRKFISRIENGQREPALGTIMKLVTALDIPLAEFMGAVELELRRR